MTVKPGTPNKEDRILKLSQVKAPDPVNVLESFLIIPWNRKTATSTAKTAKLFADTGEANNEGRSPTWLLLADSKTHPPDLIGVVSNRESADALEMIWTDQGNTVAVKAKKLLALRGITIPRGTRMFISVYEDVDPDFGKVVGIRINSATFQPINFLTEEEREERARKIAEKKKAKELAKAKEQEQAVAEQPSADATDTETEVQ